MKAIILYHPQSSTGRPVEEFARDFEAQNGQAVELQSLETPEGAAMAQLYDIVRYPAVLVVDDNMSIQKEWQGEALPLMSEVAGYLAA